MTIVSFTMANCLKFQVSLNVCAVDKHQLVLQILYASWPSEVFAVG